MWIADGKSAELTDVEFAMSVVAHNAAAHHQDAHTLGRFDKLPNVDFPRALALLSGHIQDASDIRGNFDHWRVQPKATDKWQRLEAMVFLVFEVPLLPLQRNTYRLEKVNTWSRHWNSADSPQ